jgi:hypothetical protein
MSSLRSAYKFVLIDRHISRVSVTVRFSPVCIDASNVHRSLSLIFWYSARVISIFDLHISFKARFYGTAL